jgi:hypothetical protein
VLIQKTSRIFGTIFRGRQKRAFWTIIRQFIGNSGVDSGSKTLAELAGLIQKPVESVILDQIS